jgi:parvulin-like peptidyl-prolyl isomerase
MTVNGEAVALESAVRRSILHDDEFLKGSLDLELLRQYAAQNGIRNSDAELQVAADELRYHRGLESVDSLKQWMTANHQTLLSLQEGIDGMLLRNKIRNAIPDAEIAAYYAEHQAELETVELYSCRLESEDRAAELRAQIVEEGANFHVLTMEHSVDETSRHLGGYAGKLHRSEVTGEIEAAVFSAKPGAVIGPIKTDKGFNLFKVASVHKPTLAEVKEDLRVVLFLAFLDKLRSKATVEHTALEAAV